MNERKAQTIINHYPLGDSVIVKRITKHSKVALIGSKTEEQLMGKDPDLVSLTIVAYGDQTHTIEIGDEVSIDVSSMLQEVKVSNNDHTFSDAKKSTLSIEDVKNIDNIEIYKYYRISFYAIHSIIDMSRVSQDTL